jgi:hypothetical protein
MSKSKAPAHLRLWKVIPFWTAFSATAFMQNIVKSSICSEVRILENSPANYFHQNLVISVLEFEHWAYQFLAILYPIPQNWEMSNGMYIQVIFSHLTWCLVGGLALKCHKQTRSTTPDGR